MGRNFVDWATELVVCLNMRPAMLSSLYVTKFDLPL